MFSVFRVLFKRLGPLYIALGCLVISSHAAIDFIEQNLRKPIQINTTDTPLQEVLQMIGRQSGLVFYIEDSCEDMPITFSASGTPAQTVLDQLGKKYHLTLELRHDNVIYLRLTPPLPGEELEPLEPTVTPTPGGHMYQPVEMLRLNEGPAALALDIAGVQLGIEVMPDEALSSFIIEATTFRNMAPNHIFEQLRKTYGWEWEFEPQQNLLKITAPPPTPTPIPPPAVDRLVSVQAIDLTIAELFEALEKEADCTIEGDTNIPGTVVMWYQEVPLGTILEEICQPHGIVVSATGNRVVLRKK